MGVIAPLRFDVPPAVSLFSVAMPRKRSAGEIPRIEASAQTLCVSAAAYSRVCGFPETGFVPPTYPDVLTRGLQLAVLTHGAFPLPLLGILHTEQRIELLRPVAVDEVLSGRCWVEGSRVVRKGVEFDLHSAVSVAGEDVWSGVTTILSRARPGDGVKRPRPQPAGWTAQRSVVWSLPPDQGRRYAAVSGDNNPIHLYRWSAKLFGFSRPIAHGWWTLARALAELDLSAERPCVINARFLAPVPLPGRVTFESGPLQTSGGLHFELRRKDVCVTGEVHPT